MAIDIASQTEIFLMAILLGAVLAAFYDVFRILRLAFTTPNWLIFIEDILFCIVVTLASFCYLMAENMGQVRIFVIAGEILGGVIYYFTIGSVVISCAEIIINFCKVVVRTINNYIITPFLSLFGFIFRILSIPLLILFKFIRKIARSVKFRLKRRYIMMYNLSNNLNKQSVKRSAGANEKTKG